MPIFEYLCEACKTKFEVLVTKKEDEPKECGICKQIHYIKKIVSQSSFNLKGDGWYKSGAPKK